MDMSKLECAIEAITEASAQFVEEEIDFDELKKLFSDIPEALWKDSAAMKKMVEIPLVSAALPQRKEFQCASQSDPQQLPCRFAASGTEKNASLRQSGTSGIRRLAPPCPG